MNFRSGATFCAGFLFWLVLAYFFYHRNTMGIVSLAAIVGAGAAVWWVFSYIQRGRPARPTPPPQSDLPSDIDFKDIKPSDFE